MNSFFSKLYLDLSDHIRQAVPEIMWIDMDFGQLERFRYRPGVNFPCVLIDFPQANYSNMAELSQIGDVLVAVRLGFAPFSQTYQEAPQNIREEGLKYFDLEQKLFEAVQGWNNEYCQPLSRVSAATEQRDNDEEGLRVRVLTFSTGYEDDSNYRTYQKVAASPEINLKD